MVIPVGLCTVIQLAIQRFLASNKTSSVLASYVKERKNMSSFYGFLPFSKAWNGLEAAWITRFLRAVKEFIPESYKALEKRVCIFILIKIKSSKKGAPGRIVMFVRGIQLSCWLEW